MIMCNHEKIRIRIRRRSWIFVFDELGADRKPSISAFDQRQPHQNRCNITPFRGHIFCRLLLPIIIVAHSDAPELFCKAETKPVRVATCACTEDSKTRNCPYGTCQPYLDWLNAKFATNLKELKWLYIMQPLVQQMTM